MKIVKALAAMLLLAGIALAQENQATDLLSAARAQGSLNMFVTALQSVGMARMLKEEGPFTVFALSDRAFVNLPKEDRDILTTHPPAMNLLLGRYIVRGTVDAAGLAKARTLTGVKLHTDTRGEQFYVNGAEMKRAGTPCANGTMYVLDRFDPGLVHEAVQMGKQLAAAHSAALVRH